MKHQKKILFISTNDLSPWGGSEELWWQSAVMLQNDGFDVGVSVVKHSPVPMHIENVVRAGCKVFYRFLSITKYFNLFFRIYFRFLPSRLRPDLHKIWFKVFDKFQPDIAIVTLGDQNEATFWMTELIRRKIPYTINVQLVKEGQLLYNNQFQAVKDTYLQAKKVFFISKLNIDIMQRELACDLNHAEQIINPFNVDYSKEIKYPENLATFNLAFVANLNAIHKGHDILFEILSKPKWKQRNIVINLYGKGEQSLYIENLKKYYQLENVYFKGFENDKHVIWAENHALVLPSRMEGMPMVVVEAMLMKRICILTEVGIVPELIEDNKTGFIAKAPTVELFHEAMERAWNVRNNWQQMGIDAYNFMINFIKKEPVEDFCSKLTKLL